MSGREIVGVALPIDVGGDKKCVPRPIGPGGHTAGHNVIDLLASLAVMVSVAGPGRQRW